MERGGESDQRTELATMSFARTWADGRGRED